MRVAPESYPAHAACIGRGIAEAPGAITRALRNERPCDASSFASAFIRAARETGQAGEPQGAVTGKPDVFVGMRNFGVFVALLDGFDASRLAASGTQDKVQLLIDGAAISVGLTSCTSEPLRYYAKRRGFLT